MRQEAIEFQNNIESEVDKHKAALNDAFKAFTARYDSEFTFDDAFKGSVAEHIRLARDEGARITADAMAAAEKLSDAAPAAAPKYDLLKAAVTDISSQDSQSAILKSLVQHAAEFAGRGAFFIIKSEHLVGWKVFGNDDPAAESTIREIHFPINDDTILGSAVNSQRTVSSTAGQFTKDSTFLAPINFGDSGDMNAVPLMARGRPVAVLYVDNGSAGSEPNIDALEMLTRVAGLTVEVHAAAQTSKGGDHAPQADLEYSQPEPVEYTAPVSVPVFEAAPPEQPPVVSYEPEPAAAPTAEFSFSESVNYEGGIAQEIEPAKEYSFEAPSVETEAYHEPAAADIPFPDTHPSVESPFERTISDFSTIEAPSAPAFEAPAFEQPPAPVTFDSGGSIESASFERSPFDVPAEEYEPAVAATGGYAPQVVEPVIEAPIVAPQAPQARLSDRPVDLPIDVPESERRIHNDARRFARLLVSEIKLYNEKKVAEGREASDLYDRLREAIDRSREMYDKRVQPPVAAKFDYFHYELVNALANGDAGRLGASYPGATV